MDLEEVVRNIIKPYDELETLLSKYLNSTEEEEEEETPKKKKVVKKKRNGDI